MQNLSFPCPGQIPITGSWSGVRTRGRVSSYIKHYQTWRCWWGMVPGTYICGKYSYIPIANNPSRKPRQHSIWATLNKESYPIADQSFNLIDKPYGLSKLFAVLSSPWRKFCDLENDRRPFGKEQKRSWKWSSVLYLKVLPKAGFVD